MADEQVQWTCESDECRSGARPSATRGREGARHRTARQAVDSRLRGNDKMLMGRSLYFGIKSKNRGRKPSRLGIFTWAKLLALSTSLGSITLLSARI